MDRLTVVFVLLAGLLSVASAKETATLVVEEPAASGYVFDVTVSSVEELDVILNRADSLRKLFDPQQHGRIAIVLHGDELQLFQKGNYSANQSLVDRARLLDRENIIDIKACQTMMRTLDIQQSELPSFIEQVPYAPLEILRLKNDRGFTEVIPDTTQF